MIQRRLLAMIRLLALVVTFLAGGCASQRAAIQSDAAVPASARSCDLAAASPWISRWFVAWELTSREILRLPDAPPPELVFYDSACVFTTSSVTAGGIPPVSGPALLGKSLPWRAVAHNDTLTLPTSSRVPVQLMSFTDSDRKTGPFFVMAAPDYWAQKGHGEKSGLTGVFLHEFAHTRQLRGVSNVLGPIDSTWSFPEELSDDVVQKRFRADSAYVAAYTTERDLLYRAAAADSLADVRALAAEALAMMQSRHARWFTGDNAVFATLDGLFLSMEGAGQWVAAAWLSHPEGGGLDRSAAVEKMLGKRRWWTQDEGLGLFLVVDRLLPTWPSLVFGERSIGALELLERAIRE
jgi:hypothetical protein